MSPETLAFALQAASRFGVYVCALLLIGIVVFRWVVLPRATRTGKEAMTRRDGALAMFGLWVAAALVVGTAVRLGAQTYAVFGVDEPLGWGLVGLVVGQTTWGHGWLVQFVLAVVPGIAFVLVRRDKKVGWLVALVSVPLVAGSLVLTGHAVSQGPNPVVSGGIQVLHVLGTGVWIGTLFVLTTAGLGRMFVDRDRPTQGADLVDTFSPIAVAAVSILAATGVLTGILYLDSWGQLLSGYGIMLIVKAVLFMVAGGIGLYNWRVLRPKLRRQGGVAAIRRSARVELGVACLVLIVTSILVALPLE